MFHLVVMRALSCFCRVSASMVPSPHGATMLDTLLESRGKKHRSVGGAVVSVCAHTTLIAAAVYATAQARIAPDAAATPRPIYYSLPKEPHPRSYNRTAAPANTLGLPKRL